MKKSFKKPENLFLLLLGFQIAILLTSIILTSIRLIPLFPISSDSVKIFIMAEIPAILVFGNIYFREKMKRAGHETYSNKRFRFYNSAYSVRLVLLSICNIFNALAFAITSDKIYILVSVPLIILFIIYKPDRKLFDEFSTEETK